jgi:predicted DNA-binding protein
MSAKFTQVVPEKLNDRINALKEQLGMSKSSIVNAAIEEYIRTRDSNFLEKRIENLEKRIEKFEKGQ